MPNCDPCAKKRKKRSKGKSKGPARGMQIPYSTPAFDLPFLNTRLGYGHLSQQIVGGVPLLHRPNQDNFTSIQASIQNINDNLADMTTQMRRGNLLVNAGIQGNPEASPNIPPPNLSSTPLSLGEIRSMRMKHFGHFSHAPTEIEIEEGIQGNPEHSPTIPPPYSGSYVTPIKEFPEYNEEDYESPMNSDTEEHPEQLIPIRHARAAAETEAQLAINEERRRRINAMQAAELKPILNALGRPDDAKLPRRKMQDVLIQNPGLDINVPRRKSGRPPKG